MVREVGCSLFNFMKKILLLTLLCPFVAFGQPASPLYTTPVVVTNIASAPDIAGKIIYVAPWGNDATADGSYYKPYKNIHNPIEVGRDFTPTWRGANKIATNGDTIILTADIHHLGVIPLKDNVNLVISPGATLYRSSYFSNTVVNGESFPIAADLNTTGPLIQPGSNSVITAWGATIITTNNVETGFDASYGWFEGTETWGEFAFLSFTNRSTINSSLYGGNFVGNTDVMYMNQTASARRTAKIVGSQMRDGWDGIRGNGNLELHTYLLFINSTNTSSGGGDNSRGVTMSGGVNWVDNASYIVCGGGDVVNQGVALADAGTTAILNFSAIHYYGTGEGVNTSGGATVAGVYSVNEVLVGGGGDSLWQIADGALIPVPGNMIHNIGTTATDPAQFNIVSTHDITFVPSGGDLHLTMGGNQSVFYSLVLIASFLGASDAVVYSDVDGILTHAGQNGSPENQPNRVSFSLSTTTVDLKTAGDTAVFTVQAGKNFIMESAKVRFIDINTPGDTASVKIKCTEGDITAATALTGPVTGNFATISPLALTAKIALSGSLIEVEVTDDGTGTTLDAVVDVVGYYIPAP